MLSANLHATRDSGVVVTPLKDAINSVLVSNSLGSHNLSDPGELLPFVALYAFVII